MPSQKLKLKLSHGMDIVDIMDMVTHTDMDTMVTILERDLPMLNQKLHQKLKLMPSHGTDIEDTEATTEAIEATDIVVTTGDRFLFPQNKPTTLNYFIQQITFQNFNMTKLDFKFRCTIFLQ